MAKMLAGLGIDRWSVWPAADVRRSGSGHRHHSGEVVGGPRAG